MAGGGDAGAVGVEADELLARLRRGMFEATDATVHLGKYRDLVALGRGGMGVVYRARDEALDRSVAIKVLRTDAVGQQPRLRREAQTMARLSHPNVVQVLEVGEHEGQTYVVMELVQGQHAGSWLAATPRPWQRVLAVYLQAGRGLAAAHAQGLVHRDFKPGNVLVGDDGRARVGDFGLAAAVEAGRETDPELLRSASGRSAVGHGRTRSGDPVGDPATATGARLGTPRYMAPEQWAGARVDHRADQWAFAASLWEALHGRHPRLPGARFGATGRVPRGIRRVLRRALADAPTERFASMDALLARLEAAAGGRRRRTGLVAALVTLGVAGALWVAPAAHTEPRCDPEEALAVLWGPSRRAALAEAFAATGLPFATEAWAQVEARVEPWVAQWSAQHRQACEHTAGSSDVDPDARSADARMLCLREDLAELEALLEVFQQADPEVVARAERATRDLPDPSRCAAPNEADDPLAPADAQAHVERLARVRALARAGRYADAVERAQEALQALGPTAGARARAQVQLELGLGHLRAGSIADAEEPLRAAFYAAAEVEDAVLAARATLGLLLRSIRASELDEGEGWARHAATWIARVAHPRDRPELERELALARGELRADQGRHAEAMEELEHAWARCDRDEAHSLAPRLLNQMGLVRLAQGEYAEATALFERSARLEAHRSGPGHPQVANALNNLGNAHWYRGDMATAEALYEQTYEIRRETLGPDHAKTAVALMNLGIIAHERGQLDRALERLEQAEADLRRILGPDHPQTVQALGNTAVTLSARGEWARSNAKHRRALEMAVARLGPEHPSVADSLHNLAAGLTMTGRYREALDLHQRALAIVEKAYGPSHVHYASGLHNIAVIHRRLDQFEAAEHHDRRALALYEQALGPAHRELVPVLVGLAQNAVAQQRWDDAIASAERALALRPDAAIMRGTAGLWLVQARWEARRDRAGVPAVVAEAEAALREAGKVGQENLEALLQWRDEHLR